MLALPAITLALALTVPPGVDATLPPAPRQVYRIAWAREFVPFTPMEWAPTEAGGAAVDPATGVVVLGTRDGWMHAIQPSRKLVWEYKASAGFAGPPTIANGRVYVGARDGRLYALDLATGKELWRYDSKEELGTRPVLANGLVYVASLQDTLFAVDAETGAWKWHHHREGRTGFSIRGAADPLAGPRAIYSAYSDGTVAALEPTSGRVLWERLVAPSGDQVDVDGLALEGDRLFAAAYSGAVVALDAASGSNVWSVRVEGAHTLSVGKGLVYVVTPAGIVALSQADGSELWRSPIPTTDAGVPVVYDGWLLVPSGREGLRWMEATSGRMLRVFDPGEGVTGPPAPARGRVYVLSNGGTLYALDLM